VSSLIDLLCRKEEAEAQRKVEEEELQKQKFIKDLEDIKKQSEIEFQRFISC
jgi:hypothetical protein